MDKNNDENNNNNNNSNGTGACFCLLKDEPQINEENVFHGVDGRSSRIRDDVSLGMKKAHAESN